MALVTTTTTTIPCTEKYTSVFLAAGEQFVLPPGATLISVTDETAITDDGCLDRSQLEELECYALVIPGVQDQGGGFIAPWSEGYGYIRGFTINGILYPNIDGPVIGGGGEFYMLQLYTKLTTIASISGLFLDVTMGDYDSDAADGGIGSICFKTIPSIGDNMTVSISSTLDGVKDVPIEVKVQPIAYYGGSASFNGMCSCETAPLDSPLAVPLSAPLSSFAETTTTTIAVETTTATDNITTTTTTEPDVPTEPSV
jgi:hypothetical protein